ncbi:ABC transporter permease [Blattabacterium cuenoti]|uniref:ABC transporter permease n=1 Tax=Blattabacterium cuenoti TaxID=1653831 RepID=UPI001EECEFA5|nr:FtsX-like permease family protein [Blattabacterium cuenoti]
MRKGELNTIVTITKITIAFSVIITLLTFSIGFGFKEVIKKKFLNIRGQILVKKKIPFSNTTKEVSILLNKFSFKNSSIISHIHTFSESNVIIVENENVEKFVFRGLSEKDYNPVFFKKFLIKGSFSRIRKSIFSNSEVILSKKNSILLGLNVGSFFRVNFFFLKKGGIPFFFSKKFYVSGLYDTGISEFDNVYIIGDMKHIQNIKNWNEDLIEGVEFFLSSIDQKKMDSVKKEILHKVSKNFMVETIYDKFHDNILKWIHIFNVNIFVISFVVFVSVIINIIVFLLILILERMKTIGILKTIGSDNKTIHKIFLYYMMEILTPSLIIGNSIGISFLILQKKFRILSLNKTQYYMDFVPIYLNITHIFLINLSIILTCILTTFFTCFFILNKITITKVIEFE